MKPQEIKDLVKKITLENLNDSFINESRFKAKASKLRDRIKKIRNKYFAKKVSHISSEGDSLVKIATQHNVSLGALLGANPQIKDPNKLEPGSKITIPTKEEPKTEKKPILKTGSGSYNLPFDINLKEFKRLAKTASGFGQDRGDSKHYGVDYYLPIGQEVYAVADGKVATNYYVGEKKYIEMTKWLISTISRKYNHKLKTVGDLKNIDARSALQLYKLVPGEGGKYTYKTLRSLFNNEEQSPYKNLKRPSDGRWWAGISLKLEHRNMKELSSSRYLHLEDIYVRPGQNVKKGQLIGTVGRTGVFDSRAHLHLELVDQSGRLMDSSNFLIDNVKDRGDMT